VDRKILDHLKALHTSEIDARNGYEEALDDAEGKGLTPLFRDMLGLHESNARAIGRLLIEAGETANPDGSFMTVVHRGIMSLRSLFNGLDESVLPGLIDGEKRNLEKYDKALGTGALPPAVEKLLAGQRGGIEQKVVLMETERAASLQQG
jgi:uncharacterized protein (TIGR02284 family)